VKTAITNHTVDGKPVVTMFQMVDTHGIDLTLVVERYHDNDWVPDWIDYYESCIKQGMKSERILLRLGMVVQEVYGTSWYEAWKIKMDWYVKLRDKLPYKK
jgi:hypothetical protein